MQNKKITIEEIKTLYINKNSNVEDYLFYNNGLVKSSGIPTASLNAIFVKMAYDYKSLTFLINKQEIMTEYNYTRTSYSSAFNILLDLGYIEVDEINKKLITLCQI